MIQEITDDLHWEDELKSAGCFDFYHTYDYHQLAKQHDEELVMVKYSVGTQVVLLPFLRRHIEGTSWFDLTSVYGYAGPVSRVDENDFDTVLFAEEIMQYFQSNSIVSVFSRLHPFFKSQPFVLQHIGEIVNVGKTVNIDVSQPLEHSRKSYNKSLKNQVNKLRRNASVRLAVSEADLDEFVSIYTETMERVGAKPEYFFSREYFETFLKMRSCVTEILLVETGDPKVAIAGSMFVTTNGIVQFHLSGTLNEYLKSRPAKLFLDEMRIKATESHCHFFNLGGGVGGREDSLFEFKSAFSEDIRDFKVWKLVVDQHKYDYLSSEVTEAEQDFFPAYRSV